VVEPKLGVVLPKLGDGMLKLGDGVLKLGDGVPKLGDGVPKLGDGMLKLGDGVDVSGGRLLFGTLVTPKLGDEPNVDPGVVVLKPGVGVLRPGVVVWANTELTPSARAAAHGRILAASMLESPLG
jgi:hypothetical protein